MRYIYKWIGPATHQFMQYGGLRITPLEKMQEKTLMASLRRRLKNQDEPALPRLPPCAVSTAPLEPHPSHIYPSVSHKGNTNVLNMQDIQRKTIGLVAQSILSAMIFTAFTSSISRNDAVTFSLSPIDFLGNIATSSASQILHALTIRRYMHCKG